MAARCEQDPAAVAALALGGLAHDEVREVERHLAGCGTCQAELAELSEVTAALDRMPPEALLEGPPDGGDLLLQRTLRAARAEVAGRSAGRRWAGAAAAAGLAAVAIGAGVLVGRGTAPSTTAAPTPTSRAVPTPGGSVPGPSGSVPGPGGTVPNGPTSAASTAPPPPGTRTGDSTDTTTGARLAVRVEPAAGWVRVSATVTGIPAGQRCRLVVIGRDGDREVAGSWLVSPAGARNGTTLNGSAIVAPADVVAVAVQNTAGRTFVTAPV